MNPVSARHIGNPGRLARASVASALFIGAGFGLFVSAGRGSGRAVFSLFLVFEALRGGRALRACGAGTRI